MRKMLAATALLALLAACNGADKFSQRACEGPDWYRDPVTMGFVLTCANGR